MAWSLVVSEPLGTLVGIMAGEVSSSVAKKVSKSCGCNDTIATLVTTTVGHYVGAATTKAAINVMLVDPVGGAVTPVSSAVTAVGHGLLKAYAIPAVKKGLGLA
jgi:hypothetical protein